jgi:AAA domain/UvrD-like helicase C-terminal domain
MKTVTRAWAKSPRTSHDRISGRRLRRLPEDRPCAGLTFIVHRDPVPATVNAAVAVTDLSPEQQTIVDAPIDQRLLVLAAAGTGKTHVLVERIRRLVEDEGAAPGRELLVISFTRAAVGELKQRIGASASRAGLVRPITFDSFATRILASLGDAAPSNWKELGYDGRIRAATTALPTPAGRETLEDYKHVFVDEIQDLVGVRASMVAAILQSVDGFTLLGDPAQAIYDHQVQNDPDQTTSDDFIQAVREHNPALQTLTLDHNFRNSNVESDDVQRIGAKLRVPDPDRCSVASALAEVYRDLEPLASFEDLAPALRGARRRIAVVTRSNIDALRISKHLYAQTVDHRLQREATDRALPPWLSILFRDTDRTAWARRRLLALAEERLNDGAPDPETVWRLLSETVGDDDLIDIEGLRRRISIGIVPDELVAPPTTNVVVSTIHRAKGLEFDMVFTPRPAGDVEDQRDIEELRILYVALSRAREELWTFPLPPAEPWRSDGAIGGRRVRSTWRERWKTTGIELRPSDLGSARPFGVGLVEADPQKAQDYLQYHVRYGDPIDLQLVHVRDADEESVPFYAAVHAGRQVGETSEQLGRALAHRIGSNSGPTRWPLLLTGATCDGVETVVGLTTEAEAAGLGTSGLWLRPRLIGLADLRWHDNKSEHR